MLSYPFDALDKVVAFLEIGDSLVALQVVVSVVLLVVLVQVGRLVGDCRRSIRAGVAQSDESCFMGRLERNENDF